MDGGGPSSSIPPGLVSAPAVAVAVDPVVVPYNLSMLSNSPVLVMTVGVALNYCPTAL
jgi:hypothetical protein